MACAKFCSHMMPFNRVTTKPKFHGIWNMTETRTTRMPAFWGYSPPPHNYPYYWFILDPKSREDKDKVTNLKNLPNFLILKQTLYATHLLKLLDKMCKYEMDPTSIGDDTEQTRFCPQTDRRTRWNQYTPFQFRWSGGYKNHWWNGPPGLPWDRMSVTTAALCHYQVLILNGNSYVQLFVTISRQRVKYWINMRSIFWGPLRVNFNQICHIISMSKNHIIYIISYLWFSKHSS